MKQNQLYILIGALIVVVIGLGIYIFQEQSKPSGVEIRLNESGISIQEN
ncbi:MAG: hypothetical protein M9895_12740 [Aquamicrobium sp.]|nr:hypothetical protein [Aquamicrobium sp.]MCO5156889.1 hypothetical protein [Aquamicrobium sp.]